MEAMSRSRKKEPQKSPWESFESGLYEAPSADQVRQVLEEAEFTQARAAALIGVIDRTMRRYCDPNDADILYAQWQLLLYHANYDIGDRAILADKRAENAELRKENDELLGVA